MLVLLFSHNLFAQVVSDFEMALNKTADGIIITKYKGNAGNITIPPAIEGLPVVEIGASAFSGNVISNNGRSLTDVISSVKLPSTLEKIGAKAFENLENLSTIIIPAGVKTIGGSAFKNTGIVSVTIPESVTAFEPGEYAEEGIFAKCEQLEQVTIAARVTRLPAYMFYRCSNLIRIKLPSGLQEIGPHAFALCNKLRTIELPETVQEISEYAFQGCAELSAVTLPSSIKTIRDGGFAECRNLDKVIIPNSVAKIEFSDKRSPAFRGCGKLNIASQAALIKRGYKFPKTQY